LGVYSTNWDAKQLSCPIPRFTCYMSLQKQHKSFKCLIILLSFILPEDGVDVRRNASESVM